MPRVITNTSLRTERPRKSFKSDVKLSDFIKIVSESVVGGQPQTVAEFIGAGDFPTEFRTLQQYEVDAGRDSEPRLYEGLYNIVRDSNLPEFVPIYRIGPAGVIFEEISEGGEVKFVTIGSSQDSVQIKQYAVGLEYSKRLIMYNYLWQIGLVERQLGVAFNALLNHIHLYPILSYSYAAGNKTAAQSGAGTLEGNIIKTLEQAAVDGQADTTYPRNPPYTLIVANANRYTLEHALTVVPQEGFTKQSSVIDDIQEIIVYNGWTGMRGKKSVTYAGVTTNKAYLVSTNNKAIDFQSFIKQDLESTMGNPDVSRFILEQQVWDAHFAVFANPAKAVQEVTLPTSAS